MPCHTSAEMVFNMRLQQAAGVEGVTGGGHPTLPPAAAAATGAGATGAGAAASGAAAGAASTGTAAAAIAPVPNASYVATYDLSCPDSPVGR